MRLFIASLFLLGLPQVSLSGTVHREERYLSNYSPAFIESEFGPQIVAPNSPYVAASGKNKLYFIDTRHDPKTAQHIKNQIEHAMVRTPGQYVFIDEIEATAEVKNLTTHETIFVFDPPYARVLFASSMNKHNPSLNLPEHGPPGNWELTYNHNGSLTPDVIFNNKRSACSDYGCAEDIDCEAATGGLCGLCRKFRIENECALGTANRIGGCMRICIKAIDTSKMEGETEAAYYQRMDKLHWS